VSGAEQAPAGWRWLLRAPVFSAHGLLLRAAIIAAAYLLAHAAGLREYVCILSGTNPAGSPGSGPVLLGVIYVLLYLGLTIAVPVLVLAAAFLAGSCALLARKLPAAEDHRPPA
jgi:hypothetical protein